MNLLDKLTKAGSIKHAAVIEDSAFFSSTENIPTDLPILNLAFSGELDKGFGPGLTFLAGESKSFKCVGGGTKLVVYREIKNTIYNIYEEVKLEKIETTYFDFLKMMKDNPDETYYVETNNGELTPIHAAVEKQVNQMYMIEFDDGYKIECADEHVLMDKDGNELFVKNLVKNKRVMSKFGTKAVKSIKKTNSKIAYDINIDAPHWYINDENGLIHHNTLLGLYCMKAYLDKYPDAVCLFYDSEYGTPPAYLKTNNIDTSRVIHIPVEHIEQLKFDIVKRLEEINRGDKVFIFIDSIGNLASKKEVEDAENEKSVADMSRAKALKSLFRIITPSLTSKEIPCVAVNHIYKEMGLYPKNIVSGGQGGIYSANTIFIITKAQEKEGTEIAGYKFTINIEKSRYVREKAKFPFVVTYKKGVDKYSGLLDLALESGLVFKPNMGWYQCVDPETGEILEGKYREKDTHNKQFWDRYLNSEKFKDFCRTKVKLGSTVIDEEQDVEDEVFEENE